MRTKRDIVVTIEEIKEQDYHNDPAAINVVFDGLPDALTPFLDNYSNEEKLESPHTILQSICRMQAILDNPKNSDVV